LAKSTLVLTILLALAVGLGFFLISGLRGNGERHYVLGNEFLLKDKYENALREYRLALKKGFDSPMVHNNLGFTLFKLGRYSDAAEEYGVALGMNPELGLARIGSTLVGNLLSEGVSPEAYRLYEAAGTTASVDSAIALYRKALAVSPSFSLAHFKLASLYMRKAVGDGRLSGSDRELLGKASDEFRRTLEVNPNLLSAYLGLSEIYRLQGRRDKARQALERCIALGPGTDVARTASRRLEALEGKK